MEVRKNTGEKTMDTTDNNNAEYWLPTHFLTDDDFLSSAGDRGFTKEPPKNFDLFSNVFEFDPFGTLDSPVSSNGTDKEVDCYNDDHELFGELTRQLALSTLRETHRAHVPTEKPWMFSTSPQSTLTGLSGWSKRSGFSSKGSPSQVPSPPLTPPETKNDVAWELLYEAAGEVARLKMNAIAAQLHHHRQHRGILQNSSLTTKPHHLNTLYDFPAANKYQQELKRQGREKWYSLHHQQSRACGVGGGGALDLPPSAWPPLRAGAHHHHHHHHHRQHSTGPGMGAMFMSPGPGATPVVKRQSTGTGVFLPRRVGTQPQPQPQPQPRKKPSGCSTVLLPARVVQALNLDLEDINNGVNDNSNSRFGSGFVTDHDVMIARRNALLSQQRRSMREEGAATLVGGHDFRLPSDWTY